MLQLVNEIRAEAGLPKVVMGDNRAAQIHADNSLADCISSHWSTDGIDPASRYSLAGGYQSNSENVSGSDYCRTGALGYSPISSISGEVREAMEGWMDSSGHRSNILKPRHRKLNVGLAWDRYNFVAVQQFEGDYVKFTSLPQIVGGVLSMEGRVKNGANLEHGDHFRVIISYRPQPHELTRGQISRVYSICVGLKVAHLSYRSSGEVDTTWKACASPYDIPQDTPGPSSARESHLFWLEARELWEESKKALPIVSQKIKMSEFQLDGEEFAISADIGHVLEARGPGLYQVDLFGVLDGEVELISAYVLFHETPRIVGYGSP